MDAKHDFGVLLFRGKNAVGWCGNFFSGAYVRGTGMQYVFTNWYTIFDEKARGQGLGRLLLRYVLHVAASRRARHALLQTDPDNFVAQNLYRSEGFEPLNTVFAFEMIWWDSGYLEED